MWATLCEDNEIPDDSGYYAEIDGFRLAVFRAGDRVTVMDATCPHAGANLAGGTIDRGCVVCPRHAWAFDLATGALRGGASAMLHVYPTRKITRDGRVWIQAELPKW